MKTQSHTHFLFRMSLFLLAASILLGACNKPKRTLPFTAIQVKPTGGSLLQARWVLGKWQRNTAKGVLSEVWRIKNDSTYSGKSYFMVGVDTVSSETIELAVRGGKLRYIPTVKNQNNGQPVIFTENTEKKAKATEMVFENPTHDFPQRITYTPVGDSLIAVISGVTDGHEKSIRFAMRRIKY